MFTLSFQINAKLYTIEQLQVHKNNSLSVASLHYANQ